MAIDDIARTSPREFLVGQYYRPRAMVRLDVPIGPFEATGADEALATIMAHTRHFELLSNSHLEADTCTVTLDVKDAGVDPRLLASAIVTLYVGQVTRDTGDDPWVPQQSDIRFIGVLKRAKRTGGEEEGLSVELLAHDYTTLFLEAKKFPASGYPKYSDTLSAAWQKICDNTGVIDPVSGQILPTTKALRDSIRFVGEASDVVIGDAVTGRFKTIGSLMTSNPNMDGWAVWQQCVGRVGLISYIRGDECIVTTATDYYTAIDSPRLIWGLNVASLVEDRDAALGNKGVLLQSFDPMTGTSIEAFWPPIGDAKIQKKYVVAKPVSAPGKKKKAPKAPTAQKIQTQKDRTLAAEDREAFAYPGVTDPSALEAVAKSVYELRSRQELEGRIVTHEMTLETTLGNDFDLLELKAGDSIRIEVDQQDYEQLGQFDSVGAKIDYLVGLGYAPGLAQVVVANQETLLAFSPVYLAKRVTTRMETTPEGGSFSIEINYVNKIEPGSVAATLPTQP